MRPSTDRLREAVFSSLAGEVEGRRFLDLFAGTGAYGLEALSRGASAGVFVERSRPAAAVLKKNLVAVIRSLGAGDLPVRVYCRDVLSWAPRDEERADLIFVDPPYGKLDALLPRLAERLPGFRSPAGAPLLVLEAPGGIRIDLPGWRCRRILGAGRHQPTCGIWVPEPDSRQGANAV